MKKPGILLLVILLLLSSSCQKQPGDEIVEPPEPQRMAYHLGTASLVEDSIYYTAFISHKNGTSVLATEYGTENFESYVPCFDPVCDQIHYFRSDMNYENVEPLPQKLEFFTLLSDNNTNSLIILDADEDYIYTKRGTKILAFSDSDINAEPILLSDTEGKIPDDLPSGIFPCWSYNDGIVYSVINTDHFKRKALDRYGMNEKNMSWYESSTLYSFDIRTGECKVQDISNSNYIINKILYADDKYVYAEGSYIHSDNRAQEGVTIRLTLETMRYEAILPDIFWEYSAETTAN